MYMTFFFFFFFFFFLKNAKNSACQEDQVASIFDFLTIGLVVLLCLTDGSTKPAP